MMASTMRYYLTFLLVTFTSLTAAEQTLRLERESFPHTPDDVENFTERYTEKSITPAKNVSALEKQLEWLRKELKRFPIAETQTSPPQRRFGYLSANFPNTDEEPIAEWIQLQLHTDLSLKIDGIALIPACYPEFSLEENYGFPRRFKIDVFSAEEPDKAITVVDWTKKDFPDPGLGPVIFDLPSMRVQNIRLTVTKGARNGDSQFFALAELMTFRAGNNIGLPSKSSLTASSTTEAEPFWGLDYLVDRKQHLGTFLHTSQSVADFIQYYQQADTQQNSPQVLIDLGQMQSIGRLELYAATLPGAPVPAIAMPIDYEIEILNDLSKKGAVKSFPIHDTKIQKMRWHPLYSNDGRYIRLTFNELPHYQGRPTLALGEIRVISDDGSSQVNLAKGKTITFKNAPVEAEANFALLVDGFTNGREIVPEKKYIQQLAKRQLVEKSLLKIENQLIIARATRAQSYWTIGISAAILLLFSLALWLIHLKSVREKAVLEVQQQIAADLHDDISGNLGTISMISNRLQNQSDPTLTQEKLREIKHLAQESFISVKEIIWHTEKDVVHISDLFEQIKRTARSILSDCQVSYHFPDDFQNSIVPEKTRRNITLLVKETLYNCAKYAKASHMAIHAEISNYQLLVSMKDDGCGFDPSCETNANSQSGRGLSNMERRAKLLGAELTVHSLPGEGTRVTLIAPINS